MKLFKNPSFILTLQGILMVGIVLSPYIKHGSYDFSLDYNDSYQMLGVFLSALGFLIASLAVWRMGKNFEIRAKQRENTALITQFPFSISRNPVYLGGLIMGLGWSISFYTVLGMYLVAGLYFVLDKKIDLEEKFLKEQFGQEYSDYLSNARRWI